MTEVSGLTSTQKLKSTLKASLESKQPQIETTTELSKIQDFEDKMQQIDYAFSLVKQIRTSLESALRDLS